jgi:hypothetical protein
MAASVGFSGRLGISASNPVDAAFDYISSSLKKTMTHMSHDGIHGKRSEQSERVREGTYSVSGSITMEPCPEELALLLPWILGTNASGTTFALAETIQTRYITEDKVGKVMTYAGCAVNRAVFSASQGGKMTLQLEIVGTTETVGDAGSFPSLTNTLTQPFMFHDTVSTLNSNAEAIKAFTLTINNNLIVTFNNSQTATNIVAGPRTVELDLTTPYSSSEIDLYDMGVGGVPAVLALTNGNYSLTFTAAKWQVPEETPENSGKGSELVLPLRGICRRSSTTQELVTVLDSTP